MTKEGWERKWTVQIVTLSFTPTNPSQLCAFGVTPGHRLIIRNYSSSPELLLSRLLVPHLGWRNTTSSSLVKATRPSQAGQPKSVQANQMVPHSTPRVPEDSSRVKLCYELTPIFFYFAFFTSSLSCDHHVITLWLIVLVTFIVL